MEAERNRRKQLLDTQAQINVAEGQKQRVILETGSQDTHFKTVVREAEARQQQALMESCAIAQQVENIARSIAAKKDDFRPEERQRALATLVELKRLEQLKTIAQSKSSSTYFFGDKPALGVSSDVNVDYSSRVKRVL
ncbi:uncharacterized protein LACBIDRAFT_318986 [Laccaria bicolor S238N-H82]|uniref:Predicted protein n=1 Tax=Laccaria bicolor (strain S238N-H82 / ATCC MYA-4686) TaxID=486041 RepID=B0D7L3_LACBS|nr:uncharacterized protein LACBIDRAFT_318986 [Laccaria bicolor S238N-H82]EDR09418.1 predicted protein [Laccaria bicolor S238N-H82]|eukprot:XP_001879767.1 predicted protein [Laccaria bicolor S238N-H82]